MKSDLNSIFSVGKINPYFVFKLHEGVTYVVNVDKTWVKIKINSEHIVCLSKDLYTLD